MENYKNVLITGGAGNLGRHVFEELKGDYNVALFDQVGPGEAPFPWDPNGEAMVIKGPLTDLGSCMRAISLAQADVIIHLGALPGPSDMQPHQKRPQRAPEETTMMSNVMGTYFLMDAARRLGVKKVIFASTYYVLGLGNRISGTPFNVEYLPIDEQHPNVPEDTYSLSKLVDEEILATYSRAYGIRCLCFRLMGVSYPYRPHATDVAIPTEKQNWVGGPQVSTMQYSDARDIAYACRLGIEKDLENKFEIMYHETDNIFRGSTADMIKIKYPDMAGMADNVKGEEGIISTKKMRMLLGYEPKHSWKKDLPKA